MSTFETTGPVTAHVEVGIGHIQIAATDRTDAVVEVRPSNPDREADVTAAGQTRVDYDGNRLLVKAPRSWRHFSFRGGGDSVDVCLQLPAGSDLRGDAGVATLHCTGRLGDCQFRSGVGDIHIDQAGSVQVRAGAGDVSVEGAAGPVGVITGTGRVDLVQVDGPVVVKNGNGDTRIGRARGPVRVHGANGTITVDRADDSVTAKTANGDIRLAEVARGSVLAESACGVLEVGVRPGVAAWLELHTHCGNVNNTLDTAERPGSDEGTVEVRARTAFGDIRVGHADLAPTEGAPA